MGFEFYDLPCDIKQKIFECNQEEQKKIHKKKYDEVVKSWNMLNEECDICGECNMGKCSIEGVEFICHYCFYADGWKNHQ